MAHCIDINHFKVIELSDKLNSPKIVVAARIALWQEQNNSNEFPSLEEYKSIKKEQNNSLLSNRFDESGNSIANTLGAFMNAIVDAAKDPFIARANINLYTAGTAFMLVRAGIDREWIVSFMGQPIIKDLVYETYKSEGRFSIPIFKNGKKQKALDKIREKYKLSNNTGNLKNADQIITITKEELNKQFENPDPTTQGQILNQFLEWQSKSKSMNKLINLTKVDAVGATRNLNRAGLFINLYDNLKEEGSFFGIDDLLGYNPDSKNMIATYIKNGPKAAREMYKELFIQSSDAVESLVYSILENSGYLELMPGEKNEFLIDTVSNEIYSSMISKTSAFRLEDNELKSILFGNKNIKNKFGSNIFRKHDLAKRIIDLRLGGVTNNLLLNSLDVIVSTADTPCKISLRKSENLKSLKDDIVKAWIELDDIDQELSRDLLKYSFYTTGFSGSKGFYEHIPIKLLEKYNFSEEIRSIKRDLSKNEYLLDFVIDEIYKNLSYMNEIVPVAPNAIMEPIADDNGNVFDIRDGFIITDTNTDYIAGLDEEGLPVYKRFVKNSNNRLYQLKGYTNNLRGGVYIAVNSLGYKDKGMTIKEYGNSSIFTSNNVNINPEFSYLLENTLPLKEIVYEYTEDTELEINPNELEDSNSAEILKYCTKK